MQKVNLHKRNFKVNTRGRREMLSCRKTDRYQGMKSNGKGKFAHKYLIIFLLLKYV